MPNTSPISSFRHLDVWRASMDLVDLVIASREEIPRTEFDICRQIFRAATSIPSNVAEGYTVLEWYRSERRRTDHRHCCGKPVPITKRYEYRTPPRPRCPCSTDCLQREGHLWRSHSAQARTERTRAPASEHLRRPM